MVGKTEPITQADERRFQRIYDIHCLASSIKGKCGTPCQVHHLLSGKKRRGHRYTIGLSPWHHEGQVTEGYTIGAMERALGPSMKRNKREFHDYFGTDDQLLAIQDAVIRVMERAYRSGEYLPDAEIGRLVRLLWREIVHGQVASKKTVCRGSINGRFY